MKDFIETGLFCAVIALGAIMIILAAGLGVILFMAGKFLWLIALILVSAFLFGGTCALMEGWANR